MNTTHIDELRNFEMGGAKEMAKPHIDAINDKSREIAEKYGVKPKLVAFHNFVR